MNRVEFIGKLNALYVGDKNCLEELLTTYDEQNKEIERLKNREKECIHHYLVQCKYSSKIEARVIDLERGIGEIRDLFHEYGLMLDSGPLHGIEKRIIYILKKFNVSPSKPFNEVQELRNRIENATDELFELKDMIYKPETREENFSIQRKISSIILKINGRDGDNNE